MKWEQAWLDYKKDETKAFEVLLSNIQISKRSPTVKAALDELMIAGKAFYHLVPKVTLGGDQLETGLILWLNEELEDLSEEGFLIQRKKDLIIISAYSDRGLLYGVFEMLRLMRLKGIKDGYSARELPNNSLRMLNHWDNIDGSIERGYSGKSFFFQDHQIIVNERIRDYARLNASIGINGVVINNVNVAGKAIELITEEYREALKTYCRIFSAYGIKLYLSLDYAAPMDIGGLSCCDPLNQDVIIWWQRTLTNFYEDLPEVGGFLIKADSEGRPGPFTYGRSHAEGANMLGKIVAPHGGIILWRCFVYNCRQDWRDKDQDRAKAGFDNFMPLDGAFADNVILQIKNGPMDFQVREPVSPLFGAMKTTNQVLEFQIAQEYTGQQRHVCYLIPMWKEVLSFKTYCNDTADTVADIVAGKTYPMSHSGIAGVANTGGDSNWTGHDLAGANYYGYGRLAWNTSLSSEAIAREWASLTFGNNQNVIENIKDILIKSWPTYEKYTSPLGIGWMVNPNHHYGPNVDGYEYDRWGTYHRADHLAIGVDRTNYGSRFTNQYFEENELTYNSRDRCPETLILFFHRLPYDYLLSSGKTLIQHIYDTHFEGIEDVRFLIKQWDCLKDAIDPIVYNRVSEKLTHQLEHAKLWRDVINSYFYRKTLIQDDLGRKIY